MKDLDLKSTNEIQLMMKQMEANYESIKLRMLKDYDKLEEIELFFKAANIVLQNRQKVH